MLERLRWQTKRLSIWALLALGMAGLLSACGGGGDPPSAPTELQAVGGDSQVTLGWTASAGAKSYNAYWSDSAGVTKSTGTKIADVASPYVHTGLTNGLTYYYIVTAVDSDGESGPSNVASVTLAPSAPTAVVAVAGDRQATFTWDAVFAAKSYNLYWSTSAGVTKGTGTKVENVATPYVLTGLANGTTYYYVLTAVGDGGEGIESAEGSTALAPGAPATVSAVSGDHEVTVDWRDVVGATTYNLYWSNTAGVTKANGTKIADAKAPFLHTPLTNLQTYYYVVTAVGAGGEGADSDQVSAVPQPPAAGAPQNLSAVATPETTKSVTLQWSPPLPPTDPADIKSYNLYRSTTPGIVPNVSLAFKFEGVSSPYIDLVPTGQTTYYYVVTAVTPGAPDDVEGAPSAEVSATPKGSPNEGGGGGETEGYGNNLSVPLVFADGLGITGAVITGSDHTDLATGLRPTATDVTDPFPYLNPADIFNLSGTDYYEQQSSSTWQASWINGKADKQMVELDWGDNLMSANLRSAQVIRVETVLRQYKGIQSWADTEAMSGYPMTLLYGQGKTEMQGTTGVAVDATERRVYSVTPRLKIQKLVGGVPTNHVCGFEGSIADGFAVADGAGVAKYSSEINVGGSLTYGFNWFLNRCVATDKSGTWRITFSFDQTATVGGQDYDNNTEIYGVHPSDTTAVWDAKSSYIDVNVN